MHFFVSIQASTADLSKFNANIIQFNSIQAFIDAAYMDGQRRLTISSKSKSTLILVSVRTTWLKRKVLSFFRKHAESAVARSSSGRAFHAVGPATENALVPNFVRVRGTSYNPDAAERRCERPGSSVTEVI